MYRFIIAFMMVVLVVGITTETSSRGVYAAPLFFWGSSSTESSYRVSGDIVSISVIVWAIIVALPLATHASTPERRREKIESLQNSGLYELVIVLLSRLFSVWIMATLMRSTSCIYVNDASVMSTDFSISCGGNPGSANHSKTNWASLASLVLLSYYLITSCVLHADDAQMLQNDQTSRAPGVRFAPYYALIVRLLQFVVCALCLAEFNSNHTNAVLGFIAAGCIFVALLPFAGKSCCNKFIVL